MNIQTQTKSKIVVSVLERARRILQNDFQTSVFVFVFVCLLFVVLPCLRSMFWRQTKIKTGLNSDSNHTVRQSRSVLLSSSCERTTHDQRDTFLKTNNKTNKPNQTKTNNKTKTKSKYRTGGPGPASAKPGLQVHTLSMHALTTMMMMMMMI